MKKVSRQDFIFQSGILAAAALLSPIHSYTKEMDQIKVGVIGCGKVSQAYLPHLLKSPAVELVSVCDIVPERVYETAEKHTIPHQYDNIEAMLEGAPFDILVNLTDMQEHGRLNRQALEKGRHVWSEKPLANSYREGRSLLDLARAKGLKLWSAPVVVNSPQFAFMSRTIQDGKLGKIAAAHGHYGHRGPSWSAFFYEKGGGSLPDLGVYNLSTLTGLLGPAKSVIAMTSIVTEQRTTGNKGEIEVEAEDNAMVLMEHANGTLSHVQSGFNYFDPYGHEGTGQNRPTISIWGTKANMSLIGYDWAPFGVELATLDNRETVRYETDAGSYLWEEGASVVSESLYSNSEPIINCEHALHVLEIIEAARESQETGRRISLTSTFPYPLV
ncbi:MAG: Gfo/Idh/MocA family oxidoreductase [Saprospiraceae bacterium]|nr:Gfo/Idh/MocA family oxidoreductase [Saprospiraceae bacterium]